MQTAVVHSSTEENIFSLDAGLRFEKLPVLNFWRCVIRGRQLFAHLLSCCPTHERQ